MTTREASHWLLTVTLFVSTVFLFVRVNQIENLHRTSEIESIKVFKDMSEYTFSQTRYIKNLHGRIDELEDLLGLE